MLTEKELGERLKNIREVRRISQFRLGEMVECGQGHIGKLANAERIAVENPVGFMNTAFRSADQTIHPYMFAESENDVENYVTKATCLWLVNLHPLQTNGLAKPDNGKLFGKLPSGKNRTWEDTYSRKAKVRSKTFPGIAKAMAEQWGGDIREDA